MVASYLELISMAVFTMNTAFMDSVRLRMLFAGMLFYGNKYWGITEANYLLVLLHCITGYLGPQIWRADVAALLDIKLPFTLRVNDCLLIFIAFFAVSYSLAAFYRVLNVDEVRLPLCLEHNFNAGMLSTAVPFVNHGWAMIVFVATTQP